MVFATTAQAATIRVTLKACNADGLVSASTKGASPSSKVRHMIKATGRTSKKNRYVNAAMRSPCLAMTCSPSLNNVED